MPYARSNGQPADIVAHLTTKCGVPIEVANKLVPKRENFEDSPRTSLTPEALDTYLRLVKREYSGDAVVSTILLLLPYTGLRIAEICGLRASNVTEKENGHVIWKFRGKGSKEREVPLWKKARRIFEAYMADRPESPWIFPNQTNTNHIRPSVLQEACRHLATLDPSLSKLTAHVLRHTFATMAILNCHDVKRVQAILGHGKKNAVRIPVVMLRYMHPEVANNNAGNRVQHSDSSPVSTKSNPSGYAEDCAPCQESKMRRARKNSNLSYPLSNEDMFFGQYEIGPFGGQYPVPVTRRNPASKSTKAQRGRMFIRISDTAGNGYSDYGKKLKALRGKVVEVETEYLFDDQYNTTNGLRVMDHDVVEVINDQRRSRVKSSWSGKVAPAQHAKKAFAGEHAAASAYAAERGFPVEKLYKKMRVRKEKEAAWGSWKSLGVIRRVFKNGNFLLASGERVFKGRYTGRPVIGHKLFQSPDGDRMIAATAQDLKATVKARVSKRNPAVSFKTKDGRSVSFKSKSNPRKARANKGYDTDFSPELSMFDYHAPQFEQTIGQFSASEAFTHGLQPANRRNPRKKSRR